MAKKTKGEPPITAVVISGAVARGSYEAGALAALLQRPDLHIDLKRTVFLGTSAGGINAALWASYAAKGWSAAEVGEAVKKVWLEIEDKHVFASLAKTTVRDTVLGAVGFLNGLGLSSLLDASPLRKTVHERFDTDAVKKNLADGALLGVGVVATACGSEIAGARSHVFLQLKHASGLTTPEASEGSSIDYYQEPLTDDHVLASSAVPVLFQPIRIKSSDPARPEQFYVDGGVRLNTPIKPAIALGARRIIIVSSHAAKYAPNSLSPPSLGADDALALVLHSVLADGMIEDLRRLREVNRQVQLAAESGQALHSKSRRKLEEIEFLVIAPEPGQLAGLANKALEKAKPSLHKARYKIVTTLLRFAGAGPGRDELLSYLFFDRGYVKAQFKLAEKHVAACQGWTTQ